MEVTVKFHETARQDLLRWYHAMPERNRALLVAASVQAILELLRQTHGRPPEAVPEPDVDPPTYRLSFPGRWEIRYHVRVKGGWLRPRRTSVTIVSVRPRPADETPR